MFTNLRNDNFYVAFPKTFFPDFVVERYAPFINAKTSLRTTVQDFINAGIQKITIPSPNYEPKSQAPSMIAFADEAASKEGNFRDSIAYTDLYDQSFTITMKASEGNLNYFIMLETFFHWYSFPNSKIHAVDINVNIMDNDSNVLFRLEYGNSLYTGLSQYDLDKTSPTHDTKTFDCNFAVNALTPYFMR